MRVPVVVLAVAASCVAPAHAQKGPTVSYGATIAGLPVGSGQLVVEERDGSVRWRIEGSVGGVLGVGQFGADATTRRAEPARTTVTTRWSGLFGTGESRSTLEPQTGAAGRQVQRYSATASSRNGRWDHAVRFERGAATVERSTVDEPPGVRRSPLDDGHRREVVSPLHLIGRVLALGSPQDLERLCTGRTPVFTGLTRFDVEGLGLAPAAAPDGVARCRIRFVPVAGQRIDGGVRQAEPRIFDIDIAGRDGALVPVRIAFPSSFGQVVIAARDGTPAGAAAATRD